MTIATLTWTIRIDHRPAGTRPCSAAVLLAAPPGAASRTPVTLKAETHNSGFPLGHDTYNGLSPASDGRIYYVLSTERFDVGAPDVRLRSGHREDPRPGRSDRGLRREGQKAIVQGKSHVNFVESQGKLYFATHVGYYSIVDGMETMGVPPAGLQALSGRPSARLRHGHRQVRRPGHRAPARRHPDHEHGHGTGADLRADLAHRPLLPLRPGAAGTSRTSARSASWARAAEGRSTAPSAARSPSTPAMARPTSPTREGTIHRYRPATDAVESRARRRHEEGLLRPLRPDLARATWATTGGRSSGSRHRR